MGKGYEENQERLALLQSFGKDLARRAKSKCELSGAAGVSLEIYEVAPMAKTPEFDRCLMVSNDVIKLLAKPARIEPNEWRHLGELIWSELPIVQIMVVRILRAIQDRAPWAGEIIENAYLDDDLLTEAESHPL